MRHVITHLHENLSLFVYSKIFARIVTYNCVKRTLFLRIAHRNRKINAPASKNTKDVAVKEEPADRSYVEPLPITNISSATSQDAQNGKRTKYSRHVISVESRATEFCGRTWNRKERERENTIRWLFYLRTKNPRRDKSLHKRIHVAHYSTLHRVHK